MRLIPAIDLKAGRCVRLLYGDFERETRYPQDPLVLAGAYRGLGADWLHVVDLDGSIAGRAVNDAAVKAILAAVSIPVQLGGGVRTLKDIEGWIETGVSRVILGTAAVRSPEMVRRAAARWPEQIAVSVDVRAGRVAIEGWTEETELDARTLARRFEDAGVAALIVTDIDRDGAQQGFNIEVFGAVADEVGIPVIAAGGLASVEDVKRLKARGGTPVAGAVLGRALYAGAIAPPEALAAARC